MKRLFFVLKIVALAAFGSACAKVGTLQGGPKDETPPQLDTARSTRNFATRFEPRRIELVFDEWVQLSDVGTQVIVSPPLAKRPEIVLRGKTVRVQFAENEVFRSNTTYTINFGAAVKDFTEGNPAKNLRFVFSTGDRLDSLRVVGSVADAFSGEPVEKISVMLYDGSLSDSVPRRERPFYMAQTEKSGAFSIENVRAGAFKIVAIDDANQNNKWDENERIAFLEQPIIASDSAKTPHNLLISKELPPFRIVESSANRYGVVKIAYNNPPPASLAPIADAPGVLFLPERTADSLLIWYDFSANAPGSAWSIAVGQDTVRVKNLSRDEFLKNHRLAFAGEPALGARGSKNITARNQPARTQSAVFPATKTIQQNPARAASLDFNFPLSAFDTSKWVLLEDSSKTRVRDFSAQIDSLFPRRGNLLTHWKSSKNYSLELLPGAVVDFFGAPNPDTLRRRFAILNERQLSSISITAQSLKPGAKYVIQLLNGTVIEAERTFSATATEETLSFNSLPLGTYSIRLIEDFNQNGRWDPANYFERRQPEPVFFKKLDPLQANFELKTTIQAVAAGNKRTKI